MILFDDGDRNIDEANDQNVIGVLVDDKTGFTVRKFHYIMTIQSN